MYYLLRKVYVLATSLVLLSNYEKRNNIENKTGGYPKLDNSLYCI